MDSVMDRYWQGLQGPARRGLTSGLIIIAHLGILALIARLSLAPPSTATDDTPLDVVLMQPTEPVHEPVRLSNPTLQRPQVTTVVVPDLNLNLPAPTTAITVTAARPTPVEPASAPAAAAPPQPPTMSEVAYLREPHPRYPSDSRAAHEEGLVLLQVLIDATGHVRQVMVLRSSGHPRLDRAACSAIQEALFKPYMANGVAHEAVATVPVEFSLHRAS